MVPDPVEQEQQHIFQELQQLMLVVVLQEFGELVVDQIQEQVEQVVADRS